MQTSFDTKSSYCVITTGYKKNLIYKENRHIQPLRCAVIFRHQKEIHYLNTSEETSFAGEKTRTPQV